MKGYQHWLATLVDDRKNATSPGMWLGTSALVLLVLVLTSFVQPIAGWFQLRFWPSLGCFLPCLMLGLVAGRLEAQGRLSLKAYGALVLVGNTALQLFFAALVAFSKPPGSFALASLLVLTLAFHSYLTRATPTYPYPLLGSVLALVGGVALNPSAATFTVLAFVGPTGMLVSMLTGSAGLREHRDRRERESLRQAIHYRELNENARAHGEMTEKVIDLLRYNHDAGNILSTVFVNAQLLEEQVVQAGGTTLQPTVSRLLLQLERLKVLINRAHQLAEAPVMTRVLLVPVLEEVAAECRALYAGVVIQVSGAEAQSMCVLVHEGDIGLRRIVENLLHNACEGNGAASALNVRLEVFTELDRIRIRVSDDGPGFSAEQLSVPAAPFYTTKKHGHGLGLFNVRQLVEASGGILVRTNAAKGAVVEVELSTLPDDTEALSAAEEVGLGLGSSDGPAVPSGYEGALLDSEEGFATET